MHYPIRVSISLVLLALLVGLNACDDGAESLLQRAEQQLFSNPDSAQTLLDSIAPDQLGDEQRARYGLLRTMANDLLEVLPATDSLIRDSYLYYKVAMEQVGEHDSNTQRRYAQTCYYLGLYYATCDSTKLCEDLMRQACKYSKTSGDLHTCYLSYNALGSLLASANPKESIELAKTAKNIYDQCKDNDENEIILLLNIAERYMADLDYPHALEYIEKGYALATERQNLKMMNNANMAFSHVYLQIAQYQKALQHAKQGVKTASGTALPASQLILAMCYQYCDSIEQARQLYETIPTDDDIYRKYNIMQQLTKLALTTHNLTMATAYCDSVFDCASSLFYHIQSTKDAYYHDVIEKERRNEQQKYEHQQARRTWIMIIILFIVLAISITLYLRSRIRIQAQKRQATLMQQKHEREMHLKNQQEQARLLEEKEKEIQYKNEIIHQKSVSFSLIQQHLLDRLEVMRHEVRGSEPAALSDEFWQELETLLDDTDSRFVYRLRKKHHNLRPADLQLCMLVRLKITNADIAHIYDITTSAVKKRKHTLKTVGFHVSDPDITLEQILERF